MLSAQCSLAIFPTESLQKHLLTHPILPKGFILKIYKHGMLLKEIMNHKKSKNRKLVLNFYLVYHKKHLLLQACT